MFEDLNDYETPLGKFLAILGGVAGFLMVPVLLWMAVLG